MVDKCPECGLLGPVDLKFKVTLERGGDKLACTELVIPYRSPRVFGDKCCDKFGDEFGDSPYFVINLVTMLVTHFVSHHICHNFW